MSKNLNCDTPTLNNFKSSINHYVNGFLKASNSIFTSRLNREFHKTLSNLHKNKSIKILKFDKGNGIVILNSSDYYNKLGCITNDVSKFKLLSVDDTFSKHSVIKNKNSVSY